MYRPPAPGDPAILPPPQTDARGLTRDEVNLLGMTALCFKIHAGLLVLVVLGTLLNFGLERLAPELFGQTELTGDKNFDAIFYTVITVLEVLAAVLAVMAWVCSNWIDQRKNWGWCIAMSVLMLPKFPFGTAFGILGLTTLTKPTIKKAFRQII